MGRQRETRAERSAREAREAREVEDWRARLAEEGEFSTPVEEIPAGLLDHRDSEHGGTNGLTTD